MLIRILRNTKKLKRNLKAFEDKATIIDYIIKKAENESQNFIELSKQLGDPFCDIADLKRVRSHSYTK